MKLGNLEVDKSADVCVLFSHRDRTMSDTPDKVDLSKKMVFTTGEAAGLCKVSQQTIIRCFDSGRLDGFRVPGSKFRRIPRDELMRFMRKNGIPTDILESGPKRILAVDDDPQILELFQDLFSRDDRFAFKTAGTGYDAGMMTESFKPQLIILDYMLPDVNGNIVCQRIRQSESLANTRVLFVSGVVNQEEIAALMDAGGNAFLKKPFDITELMQHVESLLEMSPAKSGQKRNAG